VKDIHELIELVKDDKRGPTSNRTAISSFSSKGDSEVELTYQGIITNTATIMVNVRVHAVV